MAIRNTSLGGVDWSSAGSTTLSAGINDTVKTIPVASTATFKTSGIIQINNERLAITSTDATNFYASERGAYGTTAASHSSSDTVTERELITSEDLNDTFDSLGNTINTLTAFWLNTDLYSVVEDFESYSTGAFSSTGNWTVTTDGSGGSATVTIESSTDAGGSGKELKVLASSSGSDSNTSTSTATLTGLTANKHKYIKVGIEFAKTNNPGVGAQTNMVFLFGATGYNIFASGSAALRGTASASLSQDIAIIAKGSNNYDVYIGGKFAGNTTQATPDLGFRAQAQGASGGVTASAIVYVDDIVESNGTIS